MKTVTVPPSISELLPSAWAAIPVYDPEISDLQKAVDGKRGNCIARSSYMAARFGGPVLRSLHFNSDGTVFHQGLRLASGIRWFRIDARRTSAQSSAEPIKSVFVSDLVHHEHPDRSGVECYERVQEIPDIIGTLIIPEPIYGQLRFTGTYAKILEGLHDIDDARKLG